jgi:hypothetical protein
LEGSWVSNPLTTYKQGNETLVSFPAEKPSSDKVLSAVGLLYQLCEIAGLTPVPSEGDCSHLWPVLDVMRDNLHGALLCLSRDSISAVDSTPSTISSGWDFALWYTVGSAFKEYDANEFLKIHRQTSLTATPEGGAWSAGSQISVRNKIESLVRLACQKSVSKLAPPREFLKSVEFFKERKCGKLPVPGLYTPEEYDLVKEDYNRRHSEISKRYKDVPTTWKVDTPRYLSTILRDFSVEKSQATKKVDAAVQQRINPLLVWTGKGKKRIQTIAKGTSLSDKLISIGGGESVRTIATVMHSPLIGLDKSSFVDYVIKATKAAYSANDRDWLSRIIEKIEGTGSPLSTQLINSQGFIDNAVLVYLEILPDRMDEDSWKFAFGKN